MIMDQVLNGAHLLIQDFRKSHTRRENMREKKIKKRNS